MRRTTSRLPVLALALAALTTLDAGAADGSPPSRGLIPCQGQAAASSTVRPAGAPSSEGPVIVDQPPPPAAGQPPEPMQPAEATPEEQAPPDEAPLFARVAKLLQSRCAMPGCHLGPEARQGMRMEAGQIYRSVVNVRSRTDPRLLRITPGAPEQSLLYLKLLPPAEGRYRGPRMPLSMNPLSSEEIALVRQWIEAFPEDRWGRPPGAEAAGRAPRTFQDSTLVNLPTSDPLGRHTLEFRILHRFKASAPDAGSRDFYGLDSGAWISLGLAYGLSETVELGLRRTNLQHDYEGYAKWVPIHQAASGAPLSLALRTSYSNSRETGAFNRSRYGAQAILARRFGAGVSLMLVPTYVSRTNYLDQTDTRGTGAFGVGGEWRLNSKMAITGEWIGQPSGVRNDFQSGSIGFSIATDRHVFHLFATNTFGSHTDQYAPGGDLEVRDGGFRLGFNISRSYTTR